MGQKYGKFESTYFMDGPYSQNVASICLLPLLLPHKITNAPTFTYKLNPEGSVSFAPVAYLHINRGYTEALFTVFTYEKQTEGLFS